MAALAAADQSEDTAFMVLMAGIGLKGEELHLKELSGLNLLFQTVQPGVPPSEIDETISPVVLNLVCEWLLEQIP